MEVFTCRAVAATNIWRGAANALSSIYIKSRCGTSRHLAFRISNFRLMAVSSKLGSLRGRGLLAWSVGRSPFLFDTLPLFRPSFRFPVVHSPAALFVSPHEAGTGRWFSARSSTNECLKSDKLSYTKTEQRGRRHEISSPETKSVDMTAQPTTEIQNPVSPTNSKEHTVNTMCQADQEVKTEHVATKEEVSDVGKEVAADVVQKPSLMQRFRLMYKQYGVVLVGVHCFTASIWAGVFYYAAVSGVDVVPILRWMGASETIISPFLIPNVGNIAVTYLMYKLATPLRYTVTIAGTQQAVKYLRKYGYFKTPETVGGKPDSLKLLVKDSKVKVKDKMEHIREDIREDMQEFKGKVGQFREEMKDDVHELKDKVEHMRNDMKGLKQKIGQSSTSKSTRKEQ